jgi:hypothetical protein
MMTTTIARERNSVREVEEVTVDLAASRALVVTYTSPA